MISLKDTPSVTGSSMGLPPNTSGTPSPSNTVVWGHSILRSITWPTHKKAGALELVQGHIVNAKLKATLLK